MSTEYGPYVQMGKLAQRMAIHFQNDIDLSLEPLVAHFMEEVQVNLAADEFDHAGFIKRIKSPLKDAADVTSNVRRKKFLLALVDALHLKMERMSG